MRKIQRHTQEEMFSHIEAWKSSSQSQKIYCEQAGLAYTTFQYLRALPGIDKDKKLFPDEQRYFLDLINKGHD